MSEFATDLEKELQEKLRKAIDGWNMSISQCERLERELQELREAANSLPYVLKSDRLRKALKITYHRDCTQSCEKHGMYVIVGEIPNDSCQVCAQEETNRTGAEWAFEQIRQRDEALLVVGRSKDDAMAKAASLESDNAGLNFQLDHIRAELARRAEGEQRAIVALERRRLLEPLAIEGLCIHCNTRKRRGVWHDERSEFECSDCLRNTET